MEKTEWLWTGSRSNLDRLPKTALKLRLGNDTIDVVDAVRVLGVLITPDLSLDKHVTAFVMIFVMIVRYINVHLIIIIIISLVVIVISNQQRNIQYNMSNLHN